MEELQGLIQGTNTVVIVVYAMCATDYLVRYHKNSAIYKPSAVRDDDSTGSADPARGEYTRKVKLMIYALILTTTCLFIR